jgi:pimeloyl-ACP methyl ester carboxylesterase
VGGVRDPVGAGVRARVGDVSIGYDVHGDAGDWVLLVMGLGYGRWGWHRQVEGLSPRFRVITFDNRGIGESDVPPGPYTVPMLARDAVGLLDALEVQRAHVVGASLGGFVAQELALSFPERVGRLVLACTAFGGPTSLPMPEVSVRLMTEAPSLPEEVRLRRFIENAFSESYAREHPEVVDEIMRLRLETAQSPEAWQAQAAAGAAFDAADRVGAITAETLVLTGTEDRVVDPGNARLLADAIPGAALAELPGGHLFTIEQAPLFNRIVSEFLVHGLRFLEGASSQV